LREILACSLFLCLKLNERNDMKELLFDEPTEAPEEREKRWREFDRRIQAREHEELVDAEMKKDPLFWEKMEDSLEQKNRRLAERGEMICKQ